MTDPIIQVAENKDFAGNPVMPDTFPGDRRPDAERYFRTVSPLAKKLAQAMNKATGGDEVTSGWADVSPETLELLAGFVTGGMGRFVRQTLEGVATVAGGEVPSVRQTPFARRLMYEEHPGAMSGRYRELIADLEQAEDQYDLAVKQRDVPRAKELAARVRLKRAVQKVDAQIRKLSEAGKKQPAIAEKAEKRVRELQSLVLRAAAKTA